MPGRTSFTGEVKPEFSSAAQTGWIAFSLVLAGFLIAVASRPELHRRLIPAGLVTLCFAIFAWMIRGVSIAGAGAGLLVTLVLFVAAGPAMFAAVLLVFVLTYTATKFGRIRKQLLGIVERSTGRDGGQVFSNVGCAALMAALAQLTSWHTPLLAGSLAALAEAACDTVSSETGKALSQTPLLITTWQAVPAGTNGAISLPGTILGALAAALVCLEATLSGIVNTRFAIVAVVAAILGMIIDSVLGATLERRGSVTNNVVNLISTTCSAAFAALISIFVR